MTGRELAWKVFAQELSAALEEERGEGDRAASYLLSPIGARMNRVLLHGVLSPPESVGKDDAQPFLRSRLTDPTGSVNVTAGGYQPRAMNQLKGVGTDQRVMVVGKVHLYRGRDGVGYVSVRAEAIRTLCAPELDSGYLETAEQTTTRLQLMDRLGGSDPPADDRLLSEGIPLPWVHGARDAARRYPGVDRSVFLDGVRSVARTLQGLPAVPPPRPGSATAPVTVTRAPPASVPRPITGVSAAERAEESAFLDVLDDIADSSADGYADLKEVSSRLRARGVSEERTETLLNRLEEEGVIEEPIVGKLRRA